MKSKTMKILMWLLIVIMTLQFIAAAIGKFTGAWDSKFLEWGYSITFMYLIGIIEIGSVVLLYISKLRKWAILILVITMLGAVVTHLMNIEYSRIIHNMVLILVLYLIFYLDKRLM